MNDLDPVVGKRFAQFADLVEARDHEAVAIVQPPHDAADQDFGSADRQAVHDLADVQRAGARPVRPD